MVKAAFLNRAWQDMAAVYRAPDLAAACLRMQERFDADVPLLLLLCLADQHEATASRDDLLAFFERADDWRETVIRPIRQVRQAMKLSFTGPDENGLRDAVKKLELEAERLHVMRLADAYPPASGYQAEAAATYLAQRHVPEAEARAFIETFSSAFAAQVRVAAHD